MAGAGYPHSRSLSPLPALATVDDEHGENGHNRCVQGGCDAVGEYELKESNLHRTYIEGEIEQVVDQAG